MTTKTEETKETIVAEISKNWRNANAADPNDALSHRFERVIQFNEDRGYYLDDWKFQSVIFDGNINETIIAVFKKNQTYGKTR